MYRAQIELTHENQVKRFSIPIIKRFNTKPNIFKPEFSTRTDELISISLGRDRDFKDVEKYLRKDYLKTHYSMWTITYIKQIF